VLGFEHITVASNDERGLDIGHRQHRFESSQHPVGAPVLGQLDGSAHQMTLVLLEFGLETLEQCKRIGRRSGKTG